METVQHTLTAYHSRRSIYPRPPKAYLTPGWRSAAVCADVLEHGVLQQRVMHQCRVGPAWLGIDKRRLVIAVDQALGLNHTEACISPRGF